MDVHAVPPTFEGVLQAIRDADTIPPEQFRPLVGRAGRASGPQLLALAWHLGQIDRATLARHIGLIWSRSEVPEASLTRREWVGLFEDAGFTHNGEPAERPTGPVTLYRGATYKRRRLMSWTSERSVAVRFAVRRAGVMNEDCSVWRTVAPSKAVLCVNEDRGESESIIDTRGLRIVEDEPTVGRAGCGRNATATA